MIPSELYSTWYVLRVKPRHEKRVAEHLQDREYETLLPLTRSTRVWGRRPSTASLPVFDGYVFCQFDAHRRLPVLTTPGVLYVLGTSDGPSPIQQSELRSLRILVQSALPLTAWQNTTPGTVVSIIAGPLMGASGVVLATANDQKLIVSISLLQRSVAVELDSDWVCAEAPASDRENFAGLISK
jgi:transcription antitermination factor NusG